MTEEFLIEIIQYTLYTVALISAPLLVAIVVVGVLVNIIQTVTSIRDQTLTFIPKLIVAGVVLVLCIPWYFSIMERFVNVIFSLIAQGAS